MIGEIGKENIKFRRLGYMIYMMRTCMAVSNHREVVGSIIGEVLICCLIIILVVLKESSPYLR